MELQACVLTGMPAAAEAAQRELPPLLLRLAAITRRPMGQL